MNFFKRNFFWLVLFLLKYYGDNDENILINWYYNNDVGFTQNFWWENIVYTIRDTKKTKDQPIQLCVWYYYN